MPRMLRYPGKVNGRDGRYRGGTRPKPLRPLPEHQAAELVRQDLAFWLRLAVYGRHDPWSFRQLHPAIQNAARLAARLSGVREP